MPPPEQADEEEPFTAEDLLWLLAEMPRTPSTFEELLADLDLRQIAVEPALVAERLAEAAAAGDVELWELAGSLLATLTPLTASRLGLELGLCSDRFFPIGKELLQETINRNERIALHPDPDSLFSEWRPGDANRPNRRLDPSVYIDPTCPEPLDVLIDLEPGGERLRNGHFVQVRQVLGIGLPWPNAFAREEVRVKADGYALVRQVCRGCLDRELPRNAYCAICHRSGVDGALLPIERSLAQPGPKSHVAGPLKGGTGGNPPAA